MSKQKWNRLIKQLSALIMFTDVCLFVIYQANNKKSQRLMFLKNFIRYNDIE